MTDLLDLEAVACDFVLALNDYRRNLFGNGSRSEAPDSCQDLVSLIHAEHKHCLESCTGLYKVNQQKVESIAQMSWPSFGPPRTKQRVLAVRRTSRRSRRTANSSSVSARLVAITNAHAHAGRRDTSVTTGRIL